MTLPRPSLEFDTEDMSGLGENLETSAGQLSDDNWLKDWTSLSSSAPTTPLVPAEARHIHTPLIVAQWKEALKDYPNQPLAQFFLKGITEGFRIGYNYGPLSLKSARRNLDCALQHKEVVSEYLQTEITNKRVSGPFMKSNIKNVHISRFGVIPKNQQANKWRLIVDLSHPHGRWYTQALMQSVLHYRGGCHQEHQEDRPRHPYGKNRHQECLQIAVRSSRG